MKTLITALAAQRKNVGVVVAALLTAGQLRSEEYRAQAAECQGLANRCPDLIKQQYPDLIKQQYEELASQWRVLAVQAAS
jgi:hypothetical protein